MLIADDLGFGDPGFRGGSARTPRLDALAAEGLELPRFYTQPVCTPTRASFFTGRRPERMQLHDAALLPWATKGLPAEEVTLAERLRDAGYATRLVGKWHLGHARRAHLPNAQGFERFTGALFGGDHYTRMHLGGYDLQQDGARLEREGYSSSLFADELVRAIETRDPARPLFLVGAFTAVHDPYQAPPELVERYAGLERPRLRVYAAMLEALDASVGRVLDALERAGIARETLLVFFGDNGGVRRVGRNEPLRGAKTDVFEGGIRSPALLRWPGVLPRGARSEQVIAAADLFPTLLRAAGLPAQAPGAPRLDGVDLLDALRSGRPRAREPLFFGVRDLHGPDYAVIDGRHKLVRLAPRKRPRSEARLELLFDLGADPNEERDLARERPELRARLSLALDAWLRGRPSPLGGNPRSAPPGWSPAPDWSDLARAGEEHAISRPRFLRAARSD